MTTQQTDPRSDAGVLSFFLKVLAGACALPAAAILLYAWTFGAHTPPAPGALGIVGASLVISGASFTVGSLIGFLFGIPRSINGGVAPSGPNAGEDAGGTKPGRGEEAGQPRPGPGQESGSRISFRDNTNLEEISDWLTKILVGVGLTQIQSLPEGLRRLAEFLGRGFGDSPLKDVFVLSLAIYSALAGFFFCYLLTRLRLPAALSAASRLMQRLDETQKKTEQTREQVAEIQRSVERTQQTIDASTPALIYNALFAEPPNGFQTAIRLGEESLKKDPNNARVWTYLAAAYGQKYAWEKEHPPVSPEEHARTRQKALDASRKAIELDPNEKTLLHMLWEGADPRQNDLSAFKEEGDADFARLLEAPLPPPTEATVTRHEGDKSTDTGPD